MLRLTPSSREGSPLESDPLHWVHPKPWCWGAGEAVLVSPCQSPAADVPQGLAGAGREGMLPHQRILKGTSELSRAACPLVRGRTIANIPAWEAGGRTIPFLFCCMTVGGGEATFMARP